MRTVTSLPAGCCQGWTPPLQARAKDGPQHGGMHAASGQLPVLQALQDLAHVPGAGSSLGRGGCRRNRVGRGGGPGLRPPARQLSIQAIVQRPASPHAGGHVTTLMACEVQGQGETV